MADSVDTLFAMNNFAALGIQRTIVRLLNNWPDDGPEAALSVHRRVGEFKGDLDDDVDLYQLDQIQPPVSGMAPPFRVLAYYRLLKKYEPDTVIAVNQFESLALCLVKRFYDDFKLVACEHAHVTSNITKADAHSGWFGWYYRKRFRQEYQNHADIVHIVSHEGAEDLAENHDIPRSKIRVVYNPVDVEEIRQKASEEIDHPWLDGDRTVVTAVRHTQQKRLDVLLRAWKAVKDREPDVGSDPYRLLICGKGPKTEELKQLVNELGIEASVQFPGFVDNPWAYIEQATLFVSTSEWEGLPNSLIEAQAVGTPIVSSDCTSGPKEILMNGDAGFLFETNNVTACADTLLSALDDEEGRTQRAATATDNIGRFALEAIVAQYVDLASE